MNNHDLTSLWRSTVGFDRVFDLLNSSMHSTGEDNYPPYNIERTSEDQYRISLALAGFKPEELNVTAEQNTLTIEGRKAMPSDHNYLHQGIAARPFHRAFELADYVKVKSAIFEDGLLMIDLMRELPDSMKPRRIAIGIAGNDNAIEHKAAA
jgi:molecular chaperone IbpA